MIRQIKVTSFFFRETEKTRSVYGKLTNGLTLVIRHYNKKAAVIRGLKQEINVGRGRGYGDGYVGALTHHRNYVVGTMPNKYDEPTLPKKYFDALITLNRAYNNRYGE